MTIARTRSITDDPVTVDVVNRGIDLVEGLLPLEKPALNQARFTDTGTVNNKDFDASAVAPATAIASVVWNGSADVNYTGIAGGLGGRVILARNITASKLLYFTHQIGGSTAANRLRCPGGYTATIGPGQGALLVYDATDSRWDVLPLGADGWVDVSYSAGNFLGGGSQTWTVDAADVAAFRYRLAGTTQGGKLIYEFDIQLNTTTVGGTPDPALLINLPFTSFVASHFPYATSGPSTVGGSYAGIGAGGSQLAFYVNGGVNWTPGTNNTYLGIHFFMTV